MTKPTSHEHYTESNGILSFRLACTKTRHETWDTVAKRSIVKSHADMFLMSSFSVRGLRERAKQENSLFIWYSDRTKIRYSRKGSRSGVRRAKWRRVSSEIETKREKKSIKSIITPIALDRKHPNTRFECERQMGRMVKKKGFKTSTWRTQKTLTRPSECEATKHHNRG